MHRRDFITTSLLAASAACLGARGEIPRADLMPLQVRPGDTLAGIARAHDIQPELIRAINHLNGDELRPGQVVFVPRSDLYDPPPTLVRPAAARSADPKPVEPAPAVAQKGPAPKVDASLAGLVEANKTITVKPNRWKYIVMHHSATPTGNAEIFGQYHSNSRGMENGLAYHFVIGNGTKSKDGELEIGSRWTKQLHGGHVRSDDLNQIAIGICLVGDFESRKPTAKQVATANALVDYLRKSVIKTKCQFTSHKEIQPHTTLCPGRFFPLVEMHKKFG